MSEAGEKIKVKVIGMGNVLMGDDGVGPYVIQVMEAAYRHSDEASLVDIGTPGLNLVPYLTGARRVVIIDTVRSEGNPGEIRLYHRDQILAARLQPRLGPHDSGVREALLALELSGGGPKEVLLIGVIPEQVSTGPGLGSAVRRAVPSVIDAVLETLLRAGVKLTPRIPALTPDIWWERPHPARRAHGE